MAIRQTSSKDGPVGNSPDTSSFSFREELLQLNKTNHLRRYSNAKPVLMSARISKSRHYVGISDDGGRSFIRLFMVGSETKDKVVFQLTNNNGFLDSERKKALLVTNNFSYSPYLDLQARNLYDAEFNLFSGSDRVYMEFASRKFSAAADLINEKTGASPGDPHYALSATQAKEFCTRMAAAEGLPEIAIEWTEGKLGTIASFVVDDKSTLFSDTGSNHRIKLSVKYPILMHALVHEMTHYADLLNFSNVSHGPTFTLLLAEMYSKYLNNLTFEKVLSHFEDSNLSIANAIYSDKFKTLPAKKKKMLREKFINEGM